jgi:hypothetical protein
VQYNWLVKQRVLAFAHAGMTLNEGGLEGALESLGDALYELSLSDYEGMKKFVALWGSVPDGLRECITAIEDLPVDIDPVFSF